MDAATYYLTAGVILFLIHRATAARRKLDGIVQTLRQRDSRKAEFLALLGHELRNPLASIRMGIELLKRNTPPDASSRRTTDMMQRQVTHMVRLIDELLDTARIDQGKIQLRLSSIPVESVVAQAVSASATFTEPKRQRVLAAVAPDVGIIEADPDRVIQVLNNLLHNASKFSPSGSTIHVCARSSSSGVVITVRDAGIGIAPDHLDLIFGSFVQVHSGVQEGLGLGLALVRKLMEMHGGTAQVQSEGPGQGAEFTLTFPSRGRTGTPLRPAPTQCAPEPLAGSANTQGAKVARHLQHPIQHRQPSPAPLTDRRCAQPGPQYAPSAFGDQYLAKPISLAALAEALGTGPACQ